MEYPDDFDTIAFPFGKSLSLIRVVSIWISMLFVVIIFLSVLIVWSSRSDRLKPYVLSTDADTQRLILVSNQEDIKEDLSERIIQEYLIVKFLNNWFNVSSKNLENTIWKKCERDECSLENLSDRCAIYCETSEELYSKFNNINIPNYTALLESSDKWALDKDSLDIKPFGKITNSYGMWIIKGIVKTSFEKIKFIGFLTILRSNNLYQKNLGFYVQNFNSYRLD